MPTLFVGHGNPLNAITQNAYTQAWQALGTQIKWPKAVLMISAHWYIPGTAVTVSQNPRTIHDFGGFPPELYQVQYPAPGDPALAHRVRVLIEALLYGLQHMLMLPARDPSLFAGGAALFDSAALRGVGSVAGVEPIRSPRWCSGKRAFLRQDSDTHPRR